MLKMQPVDRQLMTEALDVDTFEEPTKLLVYRQPGSVDEAADCVGMHSLRVFAPSRLCVMYFP